MQIFNIPYTFQKGKNSELENDNPATSTLYRLVLTFNQKVKMCGREHTRTTKSKNFKGIELLDM